VRPSSAARLFARNRRSSLTLKVILIH
jgi:hypothetical protein